MKAHYFQHVAFEGLGSIEPWLIQNGCDIGCTRFFLNDALPAIDGVDFLIVMGGPMSVNDVADHPWLEEEKAFIQSFIATGKPVLGVCLGAQLIASALGAKVYANTEKEIGWFPVHAAAGQSNSNFNFPEQTEVFHWHGETFELPQGAKLLASSEACKHQAFSLGDSVLGLQFHLETTTESAQAIVTHCRDELMPSAYIQSESEILSKPLETYTAINALMEDLLVALQEKNL